MKREYPISFTAEMVKAILEGRKTQTRRIIQKQPVHQDGGYFWPSRKDWKIAWAAEDSAAAIQPGFKVEAATEWFVENNICPYGKPGDELWVRESWAVDKRFDHLKPSDLPGKAYRAITYLSTDESIVNPCSEYQIGRTRSSRFMPRCASRIRLGIIDIRVERLQDISAEDSFAEGVSCSALQWPESFSEWPGDKAAFRHLWDSINAKRGFGWDANPWVWVIKFEKEAL